jgi:hypothetical protein
MKIANRIFLVLTLKGYLKKAEEEYDLNNCENNCKNPAHEAGNKKMTNMI